MYNCMFYIGSTLLYFCILREATEFFFIKKKFSMGRRLLIWCCIVCMSGASTKFVTIPMGMLLFEIVTSLFYCKLLFKGKFSKILIWILMFSVLGMITETLVGYLFLYIGISVDQEQMLGSFISKLMLITLLMIVSVKNNRSLKQEISKRYLAIAVTIPLGSILIINTLFSVNTRNSTWNIRVCSLVSSIFILGINLLVFHIYESLSRNYELQKQQVVCKKSLKHIKEKFMRDKSLIVIFVK